MNKRIEKTILFFTVFIGTTINPLTNTKSFNQYLNDFNKIEGWFEKPFLKILKIVDTFQKEKMIQGHVAEIGVYHGKSLIPLSHLTKNDELILAVDCFDDQQYNYDNSGMGCAFNKFYANYEKYCKDDLERLVIYKCDSSKINFKDLQGKVKNEKFRLFSIDGCHRAKETFIDLHNAYQSLQKGGVIIIDDFFNKDWPGVCDGVSKYLQQNQNLKPFFIGFNKVLLTTSDYAKIYVETLKKRSLPKKDAIFFDTTVLIFE